MKTSPGGQEIQKETEFFWGKKERQKEMLGRKNSKNQ